MLDVNAQLEGNVEPAFKSYDYEVNLAVFRTLCDRYGIEVSAEAAVDLMDLFDGFDCAPEDLGQYSATPDRGESSVDP